jgi:perosamine synthetase
MTGYQAAMGRVQLRKIDAIIEKKRSVARLYDRALANVLGIQAPTQAQWAQGVVDVRCGAGRRVSTGP